MTVISNDIAKAFKQAIKAAKKDGSWFKMTNSPEFIERINRDYAQQFKSTSRTKVPAKAGKSKRNAG